MHEAPPLFEESRVRGLAWAVLLAAFATFCAILATVGYSGWRYVSSATVAQEAQLFADVPAGVTYQPRGSAEFRAVERGGEGSLLHEGDRVRVAPPSSAGYGKVASIQLVDGSSLDIRAGTEVSLATYRRARWLRSEQSVTVAQASGYVRYNLQKASQFDATSFVVDLGNGVVVDLASGGSYSIHVRPPARTLLLAGGRKPRVQPDAPLEVAVRAGGQATVRGGGQRVVAGPGELVVVQAGVPAAPRAAAWELLRDSAFDRYADQERPEEVYNNTTIPNPPPTLMRSDTWIVYGQSPSGPLSKEDQGQFGLAKECLDPQPAEGCARVTAARFLRTGSQTQTFITGIAQTLGDPVAPNTSAIGADEPALVREGVDVTEYRSLILSADLRILNQSLDRAGQAGSECPLLIRLRYRRQSPADPDSQQVFCFWYKDGPGGTVNVDSNGYFASRQVEQYAWTRFVVDLRDVRYLPDARFVQSIEVEARGHDYNAEIANVSLVGTQ